jgi:hypothetical protein
MQKKPISILFFGLAGFGLLFALAVGLGAGVILASLRLTREPTPSIQEGTIQPGDPTAPLSENAGEIAAGKVAYELGARVSETDPVDYSWGGVRVFKGADSTGGLVVIEVSREDGYLTGLETYGRYPYSLVVGEVEALSTARLFVAQHAPDLDLDEFNLTVNPPGPDSTLKMIRLEWQTYTPNGVRLPQRVIVYIDGETGQVSDFIRITLPVLVDTTPNISRLQAEESLLRELDGLDQAHLLDVELVVLPAPHSESGQRLVWAFTVQMDSGVPLTSPIILSILVDAHTGNIVEVES